MKKVKSYYLEDSVIVELNRLAKLDNRGASDWLNLYLTDHLLDNYKKLLVPLYEKKSETKSTQKPDNEEFEMVWRIYEKKGNKKTSLAKFNKLSSSQKALMADHIYPYVNSTPDKQFRKNLETYINQECWNDEVIQNGQSREKTFETSSDRYAEQSKRLQERERDALGHDKDSAFIQING